MRSTVRAFIGSVVVALLLAGVSGLAWAGASRNYDRVVPDVEPLGGPAPIDNKDNGGTPGTIQLWYAVTAPTFPLGVFAQFRLNLSIEPGQEQPDYPATLTLSQTGSQNLVLTPAQTGFTVSGTGWSDSTVVTIVIPPEVAADPTLNEDGAELVGNLQMQAGPPGTHLGTPSTVQVHLALVHPTACLRVYNFLTAQDDSTRLTSADLNVNKKDGTVRSTAPGQFSDDVLVVNTCPMAQAFDLKVTLDPNFQTNPANNPGNAVFTYLTTGEVEPSTFDLGSFGTGTPRGQLLCLGNVTVPVGDMFLATVHTEMQKGISSPSSATFSAALYGAGTGCSGDLDTVMADPNPASTALSFTIK